MPTEEMKCHVRDNFCRKKILPRGKKKKKKCSKIHNYCKDDTSFVVAFVKLLQIVLICCKM